MSRGTVQGLALGAVMLAVGVLSWSLHLRPRLVVDTRPLAALPSSLSEWSSTDLPLDGAVESMLRADFNVQRAYAHRFGDIVWLYVGYYGTERGGQPEHTPETCFQAHGWTITKRSHVTVGAEPRRFEVNEYVVELGGRRQLVHFWFRSHRSTGLLRGFDQALDRLLGRLLDGRADGSLVRISTPLEDGDEPVARSRLVQFAVEIEAQLGRHWPLESVPPA